MLKIIYVKKYWVIEYSELSSCLLMVKLLSWLSWIGLGSFWDGYQAQNSQNIYFNISYIKSPYIKIL